MPTYLPSSIGRSVYTPCRILYDNNYEATWIGSLTWRECTRACIGMSMACIYMLRRNEYGIFVMPINIHPFNAAFSVASLIAPFIQRKCVLGISPSATSTVLQLLLLHSFTPSACPVQFSSPQTQTSLAMHACMHVSPSHVPDTRDRRRTHLLDAFDSHAANTGRPVAMQKRRIHKQTELAYLPPLLPLKPKTTKPPTPTHPNHARMGKWAGKKESKQNPYARTHVCTYAGLTWDSSSKS